MPAIQQATVNLFADMGVAAGHAAAGPGARDRLDRPTRSGLARRRRRTAPLGNGVFEITGVASDAGGVVAGVEVSLDGGGRGIRPRARIGGDTGDSQCLPSAGAILSRAVDDSGNLEGRR